MFDYKSIRNLPIHSRVVLSCSLFVVVISLIGTSHGYFPSSRSNAWSRSVSLSSSSSSSVSSSCNYNKIFVAGASKGVGHAIVQKLSELGGIKVVALVRGEDSKQELDQMVGVTAILGDALDTKNVYDAMDGCDAAITTLGGTTDDRRVDYEGNSNVIQSAGKLGVEKIILVTSIGCGSSKAATPPNVLKVLKNALKAKEKAENMLIDSSTTSGTDENRNFCIIRPGGLVSETMTGKAILTEDTTAIGSIHREDVAELVIKALYSTKTVRKVLSAVDPSIASSVAIEGKVIPIFEM